MSVPLYSIEILRLAASVADRPRLAIPDATVERHSPVCGSRIVVDVELDAAGRIGAFGQQVHACALGQASAVLLAEHVVGRPADDLAQAAAELRAYLGGASDNPGAWPGLEVFSAARAHPARHGAILLAFEAAADAAQTASA